MADDENAHIASRQQVFDTTELLEQILLLLPMKDLLLDQRVCKTWKNCIDNSVKLQRALFFRPVGEMKVEEYERYVKRGHRFSVPKLETRYRISAEDCTMNSLLSDKIGHDGLARHAMDELDESTLPLSFRHPGASWRRMLATQPPLPTMQPVRRPTIGGMAKYPPRPASSVPSIHDLFNELDERTWVGDGFYSKLRTSLSDVEDPHWLLRGMFEDGKEPWADEKGKHPFELEFGKHRMRRNAAPQGPSTNDQPVIWVDFID